MTISKRRRSGRATLKQQNLVPLAAAGVLL